MASTQTIVIDTELDLSRIRAQVEELAESFDRMAADLRDGLAKLDQVTTKSPDLGDAR